MSLTYDNAALHSQSQLILLEAELESLASIFALPSFDGMIR